MAIAINCRVSLEMTHRIPTNRSIMNVVKRALLYIYDNLIKPEPPPPPFELARARQDMGAILRQIETLMSVCEEAYSWPLCPEHKLALWVCVNDLVGQRTIALRNLEYLERGHSHMADSRYVVKTHIKELKLIYAAYQEIAQNGPVIEISEDDE